MSDIIQIRQRWERVAHEFIRHELLSTPRHELHDNLCEAMDDVISDLIDDVTTEPPKPVTHCPNHPTQPAASPIHSDLCAECLLKTPQPTS